MKHLLLSLLIALSFNVSAEMRTTQVNSKELKCFTDNLYHEARGESIRGIVLVGETVLNRLEDDRWPSTICAVVHQRDQFSWTLEVIKEPKDKLLYKMLENLAYIMISQRFLEDRQETNHYLRCDWRHKVNWWKSMEFYGRVGQHCFYKG